MLAYQLLGSTAVSMSARVQLRFPRLGQLMLRTLRITGLLSSSPSSYPPLALFWGPEFDDSRIPIGAADRQEIERVLAPLAQIVSVEEIYPHINTKEQLRRVFLNERNRILYGFGIFEIANVHSGTSDIDLLQSCATFAAQACVGAAVIHPKLTKIAPLLTMYDSLPYRRRLQSSAWWQTLVATHKRTIEREWRQDWRNMPAPAAWMLNRFEARFKSNGTILLMHYPAGSMDSEAKYSAGEIGFASWKNPVADVPFWMAVAEKRLQHVVQTPGDEWPWMITGTEDQTAGFLAHWRAVFAAEAAKTVRVAA